MLRVYVGCFGSGLGHATRMLEVADLVSKRGAEVRFSSSGEVARMVEGRGYDCNQLPLADVRYSDDGAFSLRETMVASPLTMARTYRQTYMEARNIARFRPRVVLSDSSLPTVIAAKLAGIPVVAVLNQLRLASPHGRNRPSVSLLSAGLTAAMGKLWELSDEILLPDLPPPYTISERNLWGNRVRKTRYIGFLQGSFSAVRDPIATRLLADPRNKVFWQVSGPPKTRGPFLERALEVSRRLSDRFVFVVSGGDPAADSEAREIPGGWYIGWCRDPGAFFSSCDVVVSRAGHGTVSQAITASKPSVLVPIPRQSEQEGNALKAQRLGVSLCIGQDELTTSRTLEAIESLLSGGTAERVARLGMYASRFNAVEEVVSAVSARAS
jgi:UDP-N-acetylglucosamine--N-acetylmuramyl-(pentapeptide) pyrophosphoryl-undecaprenol N-acetylglucosamine transferase